MNKEYIEYLALLKLTQSHYKIILILNTGVYNLAALSGILHCQRQFIFRNIKQLEEKGLIEIDRKEGRKKFYRAVTDLKKIKN